MAAAQAASTGFDFQQPAAPGSSRLHRMSGDAFQLNALSFTGIIPAGIHACTGMDFACCCINEFHMG
jgi:hypothetical protein